MEPFSDILNLDIDAFMTEYEAREGRTLASERKEVEKILKRKAEIEALPASASIGMFHVDLSTIRNSLMKKMGSLSHRVMSLVADRMNIKCSAVESQFSQVSQGISKAPTNIEEATELKELVKNVPKDTQEAVDAIEEVIQCAYFLDDLEFEMSDDLFNLRWKCFGWPYKLEDQCRHVGDLILKEENRLKDEMIAEQASFVLEVTAVENEINEFAQYSDLSAVEEISANVRRIQAKMKEFEDKSRLFNSREGYLALSPPTTSDLEEPIVSLSRSFFCGSVPIIGLSGITNGSQCRLRIWMLKWLNERSQTRGETFLKVPKHLLMFLVVFPSPTM